MRNFNSPSTFVSKIREAHPQRRAFYYFLTLGVLATVYFYINYKKYVSARYASSSFHYRNSNDAIVSNESAKLTTIEYTIGGYLDNNNDDRIFLHEASGNNYLNLRQTCCVESAAMHNPGRKVQLFMHTLERPNTCSQWYTVLSKYPNIELILVDNKKYFANSPFENWFLTGKWKKSRFSTEHFADYLRVLSLHKGGGLYLDLDFIVMKTLQYSTLSNFFVLEDHQKSVFANSVFHLTHGHNITKMLIQHLVNDYDPDSWNYHGSEVITAVMEEACLFDETNPNKNKCNNVKWLSHSSFFPIPYDEWQHIFHPQYGLDSKFSELNETFAIHTWNKMSHHYPVVFDNSQLYSILAFQNCPHTVNVASHQNI